VTYPKVTVRGEDLPDPFDGWGDIEHSSGDRAVYLPTRFELLDSHPFLYLVWKADGKEERRWIHTDNIDSVDVTHDHGPSRGREDE